MTIIFFSLIKMHVCSPRGIHAAGRVHAAVRLPLVSEVTWPPLILHRVRRVVTFLVNRETYRTIESNG